MISLKTESSPTRELELLSKVALFSGLDRAELMTLADCLERRRYAPGECVVHQGDMVRNVWFVLAGSVKHRFVSSAGRELIVRWHKPGHLFGLRSLVTGGLQPADVVAMEPTELFVMTSEQLANFLDMHPKATQALVWYLVERIHNLSQRLQNHVFLTVQQRLAALLCEFAHIDGEHSVIHLSQFDLAALLGTSRETVNVWLRFFERKTWIERKRRYITITQLETLREYAWPKD